MFPVPSWALVSAVARRTVEYQRIHQTFDTASGVKPTAPVQNLF